MALLTCVLLALDFSSSATRLFLLTVVAIVGICVKVIAA